MRKFFVMLGLLFVCMSFCSADQYDYLAKKISKGTKGLTNKKVAILPFQYYDGRKSPGSTIVAEHLTTKIVERGEVQVVERTLLNKIMDEMKLEKSGVIDNESTKELGKILGVEAIITGVLIEETEVDDDDDDEREVIDEVSVNARLIKVETGDILVAAAKKIKKTWKDEPNIGEDQLPGVRVHGTISHGSEPSKTEQGMLTEPVEPRDIFTNPT